MRPYPKLSEEAYQNDQVHKREVLSIIADEILDILIYYGEADEKLTIEDFVGMNQTICKAIDKKIAEQKKQQQKISTVPPRAIKIESKVLDDYYKHIFSKGTQ